MDDPLVELLCKQHDNLKSELKDEINLLRTDIQSWRADLEDLKRFKWQAVGMGSVLFLLLEVGFHAAELILNK